MTPEKETQLAELWGMYRDGELQVILDVYALVQLQHEALADRDALIQKYKDGSEAIETIYEVMRQGLIARDMEISALKTELAAKEPS